MQRSKPCVDIQLHTFSVAKYVILRQIPSLRQIRTNYPIQFKTCQQSINFFLIVEFLCSTVSSYFGLRTNYAVAGSTLCYQ